MQIVVPLGGTMCCLYDETIDLAALGHLLIRRASHVEPNDDGLWIADMAPVAGPKLGPFTKRSDALSAERDWLLMHRLIATAITSA